MAFLTSVLTFIVVLTVLVFFHELGHYAVARWRGIGVAVFSVGFGREIIGWTDRSGTRWKISWVPFGGYVKFVGDMGVTSIGSDDGPYTAEEMAKAFHTKPLGSRAAVVVAGPVANFVLAVLLLAGLFVTVGQPFTPPVIGGIQPGTVAEAAGFAEGDRVIRVGSAGIDRFEDLRLLILSSPGRELKFVVVRDGEELVIRAAPGIETITDNAGNDREIGILGVFFGPQEQIRRGPVSALWYASKQTWFIAEQTLVFLGRMITGSMPADDLRGPIGIAQISGQVAQFGITPIIEFMALLSISLGLINLFPVPMLDGGHLLFYGFELVRGRPLGRKAQEIGYRIGFAMVLMLMIFATWNDFVQLNVVDRLRGLF